MSTRPNKVTRDANKRPPARAKPRALDRARLVHELEVDWAGVEVILRMQEELAAARKRIAELESALAAAAAESSKKDS